MPDRPITKRLPALRVHQWHAEWDKVLWDGDSHKSEPPKEFYLFSIPAAHLRALSGIQRRSTAGGTRRAADLGIQRRHDEQRSRLIADYVRFGYPWSELNKARRESGEFDDLRKPGWLPTAIVINVLKRGEKRLSNKVLTDDLISIADEPNGRSAWITLPKSFTGKDWEPSELSPIEVIDGQHRLWAFEGASNERAYELPVVAFAGLDIGWQAYLFWTINISPKRISRSLAFDLYPLLRLEDWLDRFEGHPVYREARAQELVEALWAHPDSTWHQRINMLGETGLEHRFVTQAAWIRSLMASYLKSGTGSDKSIGGLFGMLGADSTVLPWSRAQQAAYLIQVWERLGRGIAHTKAEWATALRKDPGEFFGEDAAFSGPSTLLNSDQGVRAILQVTNDLSVLQAAGLGLTKWESPIDADASDLDAVTASLKRLANQPATKFLDELSGTLATYDWRSYSAPGLDQLQQQLKARFRGSGGYRELREDVLRHLASRGQKSVSSAAKRVIATLGQ